MPKPLHSAEYSLFIAELRAARERAGMSQVEVAKEIGEDQTFVSKCERGVRRLDVVELKRWTEALGIGLVEFVEMLDRRLDASRALKAVRGPRGRR
jgi:ribosome-binding protein aMBF1 (putative translation factor)